jgi:uncharacterized protein (TIGR03084 family)
MNIFDDLEAEEENLEAILDALGHDQWTSPSGAPGWSVADVVLHLAQSEEAVIASALAGTTTQWNDRQVGTLDDVMGRMVTSDRTDAGAVFDRWQSARRSALQLLRDADGSKPLAWAAAPLRPATLATTRLAEHWAHGLDITGPLGIAFPDTARLHHVAWLGHRSLPYGFSLLGEEPRDVYCELVGPEGEHWTYGSPETPTAIRGTAAAFCRVGAQRLAPERSGLAASGPFGMLALGALRNYAA